jgi:hypothetical protein
MGPYAVRSLLEENGASERRSNYKVDILKIQLSSDIAMKNDWQTDCREIS